MLRRIMQDVETGKPKPRQRGYVYQKGRKKAICGTLKNARTVDIELTFQGNTDRKRSG